MYSGPLCNFCDAAKRLFLRNNLEFNEIDISDKDGLRIAIELKRGQVAEVLLNNLYKQTMLGSVFGINMVALINGQPKLVNLKQVLDSFLAHRREVVTRRTIFNLNKSINRAHILEGQTIALTNIDK